MYSREYISHYLTFITPEVVTVSPNPFCVPYMKLGHYLPM